MIVWNGRRGEDEGLDLMFDLRPGQPAIAASKRHYHTKRDQPRRTRLSGMHFSGYIVLNPHCSLRQSSARLSRIPQRLKKKRTGRY